MLEELRSALGRPHWSAQDSKEPFVWIEESQYEGSEIECEVAEGSIYFDPSTGTIVDCDEDIKNLTIPETIDGVKVTAIGDYAFGECKLANIEIPGSVTTIGIGAFYRCRNLTSVMFPAGVSDIGENVFFECMDLQEINVSENNSRYCSINGVLFNKAKTELLMYPCAKSLNRYVVPEGTVKIATRAFASVGPYGGEAVGIRHRVMLPDSLRHIETMAFHDSVISEVRIPKRVETIGALAFCGIELEGIHVDEDNPWYSSQDGVLFNKNKTVLIQYPQGNGQHAYQIPETVTGIGAFAFWSNEGLLRVGMPNRMTSVGPWAFERCERLKEACLSGGVKTIGEGAFLDCHALNYAVVPSSVTNIGDYAFGYRTLSEDMEAATDEKKLTTYGELEIHRCGNFTIYGEPASPAAKRYADEHGIPYTALQGTRTKLEQFINCETSWTKTLGDEEFALRATSSGNGILSYRSQDPEVATVTDEGTVVITGTGATEITITAAETDTHASCETTVRIEVNPPKIKRRKRFLK